MFKFKNNPVNAVISVSIENGPVTHMYYPHGAVVEMCGEQFIIGTFLFTPVIENVPHLGRKIYIEKGQLTQ